MRNFFDSPHLDWPRLRGALHVYVVPGSEFAATVQPVVDAVEAFGGCAAVKPAWQHATVTQIPWWREEVEQDALDAYAAALAAVAAESTAFDIALQGPFLHDYGVGLAAPEDAPWKQLLTSVREAATRVFGVDRALPDPPPMPHVTLGYGTAEVDSAPLQRALDGLRTPATLSVDTLHFVAVDVDLDRGVFTWDPISSQTIPPPGNRSRW